MSLVLKCIPNVFFDMFKLLIVHLGIFLLDAYLIIFNLRITLLSRDQIVEVSDDLSRCGILCMIGSDESSEGVELCLL
jgi:hypothetical protein